MRGSSVTEDLELLTGKIIRGDITPIVYDIVSKSGYMNLFITDYLAYMSDEERERNVSKQDVNNDTVSDSNRGFSFEEWLAKEGELVSVQRGVRRRT